MMDPSTVLCGLFHMCPALFSRKRSRFLINWRDTENMLKLKMNFSKILMAFLPFPLSLSLSFSPSSAFQVDVIVDLRPLDGDAPLHRDVVLLLKCEKSVNWVIKAHSVIGKLDIVV